MTHLHAHTTLTYGGGGGSHSYRLNSLINRELKPTTFSPLLSTTALALILSACGGGGGGGSPPDNRPAITLNEFTADSSRSARIATVSPSDNVIFEIEEDENFSNVNANRRKLHTALTDEEDVDYSLTVTDHRGRKLDDNAHPFELVEDNNVKGIVSIKAGVTSSDLDHETISAYKVTVTLSKTGFRPTDAVFEVRVADVNEAPVLLKTSDSSDAGTSIALNVNENVTRINTGLTATDQDQGDSLTWSISGEDAARFQINDTTGALRWRSNPDYENLPADGRGTNKNIYDVTITVTDGSISDSVELDITLANVVDEAPVLDDGGTANTIAGGSDGGSPYGVRETGLYVDLIDGDTDIPAVYRLTIASISIDDVGNVAALSAFVLERDPGNAPTNGMRYKLVVRSGQTLHSDAVYAITISQNNSAPWTGLTKADDTTLTFTTTANSAATGAVTLAITDEGDSHFGVDDIVTADVSGLMDANGIDMSTLNYAFYKAGTVGNRLPNQPALQTGTEESYTIQSGDLTAGQKIRVVVTYSDEGGTKEQADVVATNQGFGDVFYTVTDGTSGADTTALDKSSETTPQHIRGLAGNDTIKGGSAGDLLDGGAGNDTFTGGGRE